MGYEIFDTSRVEWDVVAGAVHQRTLFESSAEPSDDIGVFLGSTLDAKITKDLDWDSEYRVQLIPSDFDKTHHHLESELSMDVWGPIDFDLRFGWDRIEGPETAGDGTSPEKKDFCITVALSIDLLVGALARFRDGNLPAMSKVDTDVRLAERLESFEACFNFRDLGGYATSDGRRVRWRTAYRSDSLHRFTPPDLEHFGTLDIGTVIDLRSSDEITDFGRLPPGAAGAEWFHRALIQSVDLRADPAALPKGEEERDAPPGGSYFEFLGGGEVATDVLSLLAERDGAAVFHCTSGKDRTGIIAAMLLDLLRVPDETIAADYEATQQTRAHYTAWVTANEPEFAAYLERIPPERRIVKAQRILAFLDRLREAHGSVEELVLERGFSKATLARLRDRMLD